MILILAIVFIQVFTRYFNIKIGAWTEEMARLFFVWGVFLGAVVGVKRDSHKGVDVIIESLSYGYKKLFFLLFKRISMIIVAFLLLIFGTGVVSSAWMDRVTELGFRRSYFYLPVPVSGALMLMFLIPQLLRELYNLFRYLREPNHCDYADKEHPLNNKGVKLNKQG